MTSTATPVDPRELASGLGTRSGLPWWAAVLVALIPTATGFAVDLKLNNAIGVIAWALTLGGIVLSVLLVRRHAIFTPMVQPPLIVVAGLLVGYIVAVNGSLISMSLRLVNTFPLMVTSTAVAILLGAIRILAQPLRHADRDSRRGYTARSAGPY